MKKKLSIVLACLLVLLIAVPVYAAASATITIVESSGNSYDMLSTTVPMDNDYLASHGFISATGLDVDLDNLPFMLASDRTIVATPIVANSSTRIPYTTGNTPANAFHVLTGHNGYVTINDCDDLELGNSFEVEIKGYIETTHSDYANRNLVFKDAAFKICVSAEDTIQAVITGGATVTAAGIDSDDMVVKIKADSINLEIYVDDMETPVHSQAIGAAVTDNGNDWLLNQNDVMPYVEYVKFRNE